ncbi:MAG: hypothetical protein AAGI46_00990 [Planctomycetota bacterium]
MLAVGEQQVRHAMDRMGVDIASLSSDAGLDQTGSDDEASDDSTTNATDKPLERWLLSAISFIAGLLGGCFVTLILVAESTELGGVDFSNDASRASSGRADLRVWLPDFEDAFDFDASSFERVPPPQFNISAADSMIVVERERWSLRLLMVGDLISSATLTLEPNDRDLRVMANLEVGDVIEQRAAESFWIALIGSGNQHLLYSDYRKDLERAATSGRNVVGGRFQGDQVHVVWSIADGDMTLTASN